MSEEKDEYRVTFVPAADVASLPCVPEPPEEAYRRGYADGWVQALNALDDLWGRNGIPAGTRTDRLHTHLFAHWEVALRDWALGKGEAKPLGFRLAPSPASPASVQGTGAPR